MIGSIFRAIEKRLFPERHARRLGVRMGMSCRLIRCDFSTEPYLISMGDHVSATRVRFETHDGGVWVFRNELSEIDVVKPIRIGSNVFLGYEAIVMPGVTIGDNVVIGARSVVTRDIPSGSVAAGVPARILKTIGEYRVNIDPASEMTKNFSEDKKRQFYLNKFRTR